MSPWTMAASCTPAATARPESGAPPRSPEAAHLVKVRDCLSRRLSADRAEALIDLASRVETLDAAGVRSMIDLVRDPA